MAPILSRGQCDNALKPSQIDRYYPDDLSNQLGYKQLLTILVMGVWCWSIQRGDAGCDCDGQT